MGLQAFFNEIFEGEEALHHYHTRVAGSPACSVGAWEDRPDGRVRSVTFSMAMQLPAMVRKLVGTSS